MRIAIVAQYPRNESAISGGIESVAVNLVNAMRQFNDLEIHIVSPGGKAPSRELRRGITIHWLGRQRSPGFITYWWTQRLGILAQLRRLSPDLVHFHGPYGWSLGCPGARIVTAHGIPEIDIKFTSRSRWVGELKSGLVGLVESLARRGVRDHIIINQHLLDQFGGELEGRRDIIANPVDEIYFESRRATAAPECGKALFVGRIRPLKNVLGLIEAFAIVAKDRPGATLEIVGEPDQDWYTRKCHEAVRQLGLEGAVLFAGNLSRDRLIERYGTAACVVLPSFQEVSPMVVEEAMAAGVPVVGAAVGGINYMIEDGRTGYLCDPRDTAALARRLVQLLSDAPLNRRLGRSAREYAQLHYRAAGIAARTVAIYRRVAAATGEQRAA